MRKSHDGLAALDRLKLLYWDTDGYALWYKRLEMGRFRFPVVSEGQRQVTITTAELTMLLDGVDLASVRRTKRFRLPSEMALDKPSEKSEKSLATV